MKLQIYWNAAVTHVHGSLALGGDGGEGNAEKNISTDEVTSVFKL